MKKTTALVLAFLIFNGGENPVRAEDLHFDPLERNLIFVEGEAEMTVPVDTFSLDFGFDIDKGSFEEASRQSTGIIESFQKILAALGLTDAEVIKGWDLVRQAKISFGSKGRKISNRVAIKVKNFPEGKLHGLIANLIDKSLAIDGAIILEDVRVEVSEDLENQKKEEVLSAALKALNSNAGRAAEALGRRISAPKRVFVTNQQRIQGAEDASLAYPGEALYQQRASFVSIQKSFKVNAQIVDHVKISARVSGVYQIE